MVNVYGQLDDEAAFTTLMSSDVRSGFQHTNGSMGDWVPSIDDTYHISHFWTTTNSWPTSLPGMPL